MKFGSCTLTIFIAMLLSWLRDSVNKLYIQSWEFLRRYLLCTMPLTKIPKKREPLWKECNYNADKRGVRSTVYSVNGDQYTGEWESNKKNGKRM